MALGPRCGFITIEPLAPMQKNELASCEGEVWPQIVVFEEPEKPEEPEPVAEPESLLEAPKQELQASPDYLEFEVVVQKSPKQTVVGLHLDCSSPQTPVVKGIKDASLIGAWNIVYPNKQVQVGDAIMHVNDADNSAAMVSMFRDESVLKIVFRRVPDFIVRVNKSDGVLGITFHGVGTAPATISHVREGEVVYAYNRQAEAGKTVVPGDVVLEVNGQSGNRDQIAAAIANASGMIDLKLKHPTA